LAGFQWNRALDRLCKYCEDYVIANSAHLFKNFQTVCRAPSYAIQVKQNGMELRLFQSFFDFVFCARKSGSKLASHVPAHIGIKVCFVGDYGEEISVRTI